MNLPTTSSGSRAGRARIAALLPLAVALGATGCSGDRETPGPQRVSAAPASDLSVRCDRALRGSTPAKVRALPAAYRPDMRVGADDAHPLGQVVGAAWDPEARRLYVLDGASSRVAVFDSEGRWVADFGGAGGGPGEFEQVGTGHGSRAVFNQLALLSGGRLAVADYRLLHLFSTDGRFVDRVDTQASRDGPHAVRHLAPVSDSAFLFAESGAMRLETSERAVRTELRLLRVQPRGEALDTVVFGTMRNVLDRLPEFELAPPRDPYTSWYRRTWDASPQGLLAVVSLYEHGLCFFDPAGNIRGSHRVEAPVVEVDGDEKERVMADLRKLGKGPPLGGGSWNDFYKSWPEALPRYTDVALAPDSVAWVSRPTGGERSAVDLYHVRRGYLGTMDPLGATLPITFGDGCAFVVTEQVGEGGGPENDFYGLRRWCPAPRARQARRGTNQREEDG